MRKCFFYFFLLIFHVEFVHMGGCENWVAVIVEILLIICLHIYYTYGVIVGGFQFLRKFLGVLGLGVDATWGAVRVVMSI